MGRLVSKVVRGLVSEVGEKAGEAPVTSPRICCTHGVGLAIAKIID